jgi:hypothetical protein
MDLVHQVVDLVAAAVAEQRTSAHRAGTGSAVAELDDALPTPPGGWANPWLVGAVHEHAVSAEDRSARGAWYTPEPVVRGLVALATQELVPDFAVDPTCGGGAFLLAAADRFVELGDTPVDALSKIAGMDIDAGAVQASRWSLTLWAAAHGLEDVDLTSTVVTGDALRGYPPQWPGAALVVGNPPFATPLRTGAVPEEVAAFREGREHLLGPYTDLAAMHLLAAVERCAEGSVVALVQPQSILAGRDTGLLRTHCEQVAPLTAMWAAREPVFDAGVRACAAVLHPGARRPETVRLASGPTVEPGGTVPAEDAANESAWPTYAARSLGAPTLPAALTVASAPSGSGAAGTGADRLGALIEATAGFRDEYYGLVEACSEWEGPVGQEPNRLVTVGAVEPLASCWGVESCRFGGAKWLRPTIDLDALSPKVRTWTERRLTPKVVLATQSKLLEPVVDRSGTLVPATPLLALHADVDDLPLVAAVLLAPPVVAWAWQQWFGSALAVDALKLAARQVAELPLPTDRAAWERAADMILDAPAASVDEGWAVSCEVAAAMNDAYGADASVLAWWMERSKTR